MLAGDLSGARMQLFLHTLDFYMRRQNYVHSWRAQVAVEKEAGGGSKYTKLSHAEIERTSKRDRRSGSRGAGTGFQGRGSILNDEDLSDLRRKEEEMSRNALQRTGNGQQERPGTRGYEPPPTFP